MIGDDFRTLTYILLLLWLFIVRIIDLQTYTHSRRYFRTHQLQWLQWIGIVIACKIMIISHLITDRKRYWLTKKMEKCFVIVWCPFYSHKFCRVHRNYSDFITNLWNLYLQFYRKIIIIKSVLFCGCRGHKWWSITAKRLFSICKRIYLWTWLWISITWRHKFKIWSNSSTTERRLQRHRNWIFFNYNEIVISYWSTAHTFISSPISEHSDHDYQYEIQLGFFVCSLLCPYHHNVYCLCRLISWISTLPEMTIAMWKPNSGAS